ncbi:hypothetical protein JT358_13810 [Micrococcales bacterium 31B]|nr:hypothetical protein [Micrococcales bacterium 31B]
MPTAFSLTGESDATYHHAPRPEAAAVLTLLLAGCSSTGSGTDSAAPSNSATGASASADPASSQPIDPQASSSGSGSASATQKPDQPVFYKGGTYDDKTGIFDGMKWQGGMVHGGASQMPKLRISGWMPGLGEFTTCNIDLSSDDDAKFTTSTDEDAMSASHAPLPKAIATTGDEPQAYVTFAATSKASGSKAGEQRLYVQSIDLQLCTAGERIDVLGEPLDDPVTADPVFVGATDDTLAISIFGPDT